MHQKKILYNTQIFANIFFTARLSCHDWQWAPLPSSWLHLPDCLKIGLQQLCLEALESFQNLSGFEYTGPCSQIVAPSARTLSCLWKIGPQSIALLLKIFFGWPWNITATFMMETISKRLFSVYLPATYLTFPLFPTTSPSRRHMSAQGWCIPHYTWTSVLWRVDSWHDRGPDIWG